MFSLRIAIISLFFLTAGHVADAQLAEGPVDGIGLLDYCRSVEIVAQQSQTRKILPEKVYQETLNKYYWCLGYVEAIKDAAFNARATLQVADKFGVTLSGPAHEKQEASAMLQVACFPTAPLNDFIIVLNLYCMSLSFGPCGLLYPQK
jgi:hypothetical protein